MLQGENEKWAAFQKQGYDLIKMKKAVGSGADVAHPHVPKVPTQEISGQPLRLLLLSKGTCPEQRNMQQSLTHISISSG